MLVIAGDFDADGDQDIVAAGWEPATLEWYRNESSPNLFGDVDRDNQITALDANRICLAIRRQEEDPLFDLNQDQTVDHVDMEVFLRDAAFTVPGDVNLDGIFDSSDLVRIFESGKYEQDVDALWTEGDWNCDGRFTTADLVFAFEAGGFNNLKP